MAINYFAQQPVNIFGSAIEGYQSAVDRRNALAQQSRQNQLADMRLSQAKQQMADENAMRDIYRQYGQQGLPQVAQQLMGAGLGQQAAAVNKQILDQQAQKLARAKDQIGLMKNTASFIMANPGMAEDALKKFGDLTGYDVSGELSQLQSLGGNSDAIKQWAAGHAVEADKLLPKFEKFDQGGAVVTGKVNPLTGQFEAGQAYQKSMTPGEIASNALGRANLAQSERHFQTEQANKIPERAFKIQEEMQKRQDVSDKRASAIDNAENAIRQTKEMLSHPGLQDYVGATWKPGARFIPGTNASDFEARLDQIKAGAFTQGIQQMKGMGALSDAEGKKLDALMARMNKGQSEEEFKTAAKEYVNTVQKGLNRLKGAGQINQSDDDLINKYLK